MASISSRLAEPSPYRCLWPLGLLVALRPALGRELLLLAVLIERIQQVVFQGHGKADDFRHGSWHSGTSGI